MTGRRRPAGTRALAAVVAALSVPVALGGCGGRRGGAALPEPPPVVTVTMREYRFTLPRSVPSGRVVFRFVNAGRVLHQPDMVPMPAGLPPIGEQVRGGTRAAVSPFAGIPPRRPGRTGTFAVDLVPGQRYAIVCFARDSDDEGSHAVKGMTAEFTAGAGAARPG